MSEAKPRWMRPQLIVLARGMPEEKVLTHCKYIGYTGDLGDPNTTAQTGCDKGVEGNCGNCQSRSGS